jgi:hypothetical protein
MIKTFNKSHLKQEKAEIEERKKVKVEPSLYQIQFGFLKNTIIMEITWIFLHAVGAATKIEIRVKMENDDIR